MLREVLKPFDVDNNVRVSTGDVVDVSAWRNRQYLEDQKFIGPTDAEKATVDIAERARSIASSSPGKRPAKLKRSVLASRPRVFTRKA